MGTTTYGEHAERVADALADLIRGPVLPPDPALRPVVLANRHLLIAAVRDRLWNQFAVQVKNTDPAASTPVRFDVLRRQPLHELGYLIEHYPQLRPADRMAPSDVLREVDDPIVGRWTCTAREMLLANHMLNTSRTQPWRHDPTAHAALASDTAQIVEAIAVIDQRLCAVGALDTHLVAGGGGPATATNARLVASTVDRYAQWVADHHAVDRLVTTPVRPATFDQAVRLVQTPSDLAIAQRSLESFLLPMAHQNLPHPHRPTAASTLAVAHNQVNLIARLHQRIASDDRMQPELLRTTHLRDHLDDAIYATRGLHDPSSLHASAGPDAQILVRGQQQEISVAVRQGCIEALDDQQVSELLIATENTLATWALAVLREATRDDTELRVMRRGIVEETIYGRLTPDGPASRCLNALAEHHQSVVAEIALAPATDARARLRDAMARTPPFEVVGTWPSPGRRYEQRRPPGGTRGQQPGRDR